jgi:hypothetical protein
MGSQSHGFVSNGTIGKTYRQLLPDLKEKTINELTLCASRGPNNGGDDGNGTDDDERCRQLSHRAMHGTESLQIRQTPNSHGCPLFLLMSAPYR